MLSNNNIVALNKYVIIIIVIVNSRIVKLYTLKLSAGRRLIHERWVTSERLSIDCQIDQREEVEELLRQVLFRMRRPGRCRIGLIRLRILEAVGLKFGVESLRDDK